MTYSHFTPLDTIWSAHLGIAISTRSTAGVTALDEHRLSCVGCRRQIVETCRPQVA